VIASLLLAAALFLGPEHAASVPLRDASPYEQRVTSAAASHDTALVVWTDADGLRGVRIDRDGRQLDASALVIDHGLGFTGLPFVARGTDRWLVAWADAAQVKARFVLDDGSVGALLPIPLELTGSGTAVPAVRIAFDGQQFLLLLAEENGSTAVLLDEQGQVLGGKFAVAATEQGLDTIEVLATPSGFAVVFSQWVHDVPAEEHYTIKLLRLHPDGTQAGSIQSLHTDPLHARALHAVADGEDLYVLWGMDTEHDELRIMRSGEPPQILVEGFFAPRDLLYVGGRLVAVLVTSTGKLVLQPIGSGDPRTFDVSGAFTPAAASFGDRALLAANVKPPWAAVSNDPGVVVESDPYAAVVDSTLNVISPLQRIALEPRMQAAPAVAQNDAGEALVVWSESAAAGPPRIAATRLDPLGRALDSPPLPLVETPHSGTGIRPLVASNGNTFLVAWSDGTGMVTRRVLSDGTALPSTVVATNSFFGVTYACLCRSGSGYLLGYVQTISVGRNNFSSEVQVLRLGADGAAAGQPVAIAPRGRNTEVACATGPRGTLFVWRGQQRIDGVIVSDGGTISSTIPIGPPATVFEQQASGTVPAVAANGNSFAVVWNEPGFIDRALVSDLGTVTRPSDPVIPAALQPSDDSVDIAPHGDGYIVAWGASDVLTLTLDAAARVAEPAVPLAASPAIERQPALAEGIAVYLRDTSQTPNVSAQRFRVFTRTLFTNLRRRAVTPR
jgi:hypothetical protein